MPARLAISRCVPILLLLALTPPFSSSQQQSAHPIFITNLGEGTRRLSTPWKFQTGDNPAWASPSLDDTSWQQLRVDEPWGAQGYPGYSGYAWYRLRIAAAPDAEPASLSLLIDQVDDAYELYWNGQLIGRNGRLPPHPLWFESQPPQIFPIAPAATGLLAFRVWKAPPMSDDPGRSGGLTAAPLVGSPASIATAANALNYQWLRSRQFLFAEHLIYALIALLSFLVWSRNREQWLLLWMMGYVLVPVLISVFFDAHIRWPYSIAMGITQPLNSIRDISLWFLLLWLLRLKQNRPVSHLVRTLAAVSLVLTSIDGLLITLALHPRWTTTAQLADAVITVINILLEMLPLVLVGFAVSQWKQLDFCSWSVAVFAFLDGMLVVISDALDQGQRFTGWTIAEKLASPLFVIGGSAIWLPMITRALLLAVIVCAVYAAYRQEQRRQLLLAGEFTHARELQRMLIPETQVAPPGFDLTCSYRPAIEVGGDFFQLIPLDRAPNGDALLLLGDVSGHGLKAALSVSYVIGIMRVLAEFFPDPGPLLTETNRRLCGKMQNNFVTCIAARVDRSGSCALASAGHPPPFLNCRELEIPGELPLGINPSVLYHQASIQLHLGDHLALFTDGLLEARNKSGELYGFDRLEKLFAAYPTATEAAEAAIRFGQDDDVTVVMLTYLAEGAPALHESAAAAGSLRQSR